MSCIIGCIGLVLHTLAFGAAGDVNLLSNASFEIDANYDGIPDNWYTYGDGTYNLTTDDAHTGEKSMALGGDSFALLYQRAPGNPDTEYVCKTWAKIISGDGNATLKLEFHDSGVNKIVENKLSFTATNSWAEFSNSAVAPSNTAYVTASIVGEAGGMVYFDDVSITETSSEPTELVFDINNTKHTFHGFGAQIWGYYSNPATLQQVFDELNIKFVRIENYRESASWTQMQNTRALTDSFGIKWLYMIWSADSSFSQNGVLRSDKVDDFADWWADHVAELNEFEIAGADEVFYSADAQIIATDAVAVSSTSVTNPVSVRYAYASIPEIPRLFNSADLPASPFRIITPPAGTTPDIFINDIAMGYRKQGKNYYAQATVWVKDDTDADVEGATVYGQWSGDVNGPAEGITVGDGITFIESPGKKDGGTFIFTVTDIVKDGCSYNPDLNVETSDSITVP